MSKFKIVDSVPDKLEKGEFVIDAPNFLAEVKACSKKKPRNGLLSRNYLREIVQAVGSKYIGEEFNTLGVNITNFVDTPAESDEQVHSTVMKLFREVYPSMFDAYVEYHLKNRPYGTEMVYFRGTHHQTGSFTRLGFHRVKD